MAGSIAKRLETLGIELPDANPAVGNYVPYVISKNQIFVSGQLTMLNGELKYIGRLGEALSLEDGMAGARLCGLNLISQAQSALEGNLDRITRVVKLGGYVNCTQEFTGQPKVINGASDLMVEVFGEEIGKHARIAVGVSALPLGVSVEVDGIFEFE